MIIVFQKADVANPNKFFKSFLGFPSPDSPRKFDKLNVEKRVSFDSVATNKLASNVLRTQSLTDGGTRDRRHSGTRSLRETSEDGHAASEVKIKCYEFFYWHESCLEPLSFLSSVYKREWPQYGSL